MFYDLPTMMMIANRQCWYYGLTATDISGGEPTIFDQLPELVRHCANIGLAPTVITHGQRLGKESYTVRIEDAGLDDWLVSLHGLEKEHNDLVRRKGKAEPGHALAHDPFSRTVIGAQKCVQPVRFNCTLTSTNLECLPAYGRFLADNFPPTVCNFIQFNPFHAWDGKEVIDFQAQGKDLVGPLAAAISALEAKGWEVNVRYFPFCVAKTGGFERNCIGFYQGQHDPWEWALESTQRLPAPPSDQRAPFRRQICDRIARDRANEKCDDCALRPICEGPTPQYQKRFGLDELVPYDGPAITDVCHFEELNHATRGSEQPDSPVDAEEPGTEPG
jgi:MoaA/NifB/PqqE/SkfB family radical SAM enzyme